MKIQAYFTVHDSQDDIFSSGITWYALNDIISRFNLVLSTQQESIRYRVHELSKEKPSTIIIDTQKAPQPHGKVLDWLVREKHFMDSQWNLFIDPDASLAKPDFIRQCLLECTQSDQYWVGSCLAWRPINMFQTAPFFLLNTIVDWTAGPSFLNSQGQKNFERYLRHLKPFEPWRYSPNSPSAEDTGSAKVKTLVPPYRIYFFPERTYWDPNLLLSGHRKNKNLPVLHRQRRLGGYRRIRRFLWSWFIAFCRSLLA